METIYKLATTIAQCANCEIDRLDIQYNHISRTYKGRLAPFAEKFQVVCDISEDFTVEIVRA